MSDPLESASVPRGQATSRPEDDGDGWQLFFAFAGRWKLVVGLPMAIGLAAGLLTFLIQPMFTSTASFIAESRDRMSTPGGAFAGVASQLGLGLSTSPTSSPQFFADLLSSRELVETVLQSRVADSRTAVEGDSVLVQEVIATFWSGTARLDKAIARLREISAVSLNPRTGIIELRVSAVRPAIAQQIAQRFLQVLDRFNLERRQTQAGQRRRFAAARLNETQDSLRLAEGALQSFLQSNRQYREAPALNFQYERMNRQVAMYQDLYTSLRRDYETARLDEVNDTPVLTIIDAPDAPLAKSSPSRKLAAVVGAMIGAFLAAVIVLADAFLVKLQASRPSEYQRLRGLANMLRTPKARLGTQPRS